MPHFLTQNRELPCGSNGGNRAGNHHAPERTGRKRAKKRLIEVSTAAHNPGAVGSPTAPATRRKDTQTGVFSFLFLEAGEVMRPPGAVGDHALLVHSDKVLVGRAPGSTHRVGDFGRKTMLCSKSC